MGSFSRFYLPPLCTSFGRAVNEERQPTQKHIRLEALPLCVCVCKPKPIRPRKIEA